MYEALLTQSSSFLLVTMANLCDQLEHNKSAWGTFLPLCKTPDHVDSYWIVWISPIKFRRAAVNVTVGQIFQQAFFFHSVFHSLPWWYPKTTLLHLQIGFAYSWLLQKTVSMDISWSNPICMFLFICTDWVTTCQVLIAHFNKSSKYVWFYCLLLPRHQLWSM